MILINFMGLNSLSIAKTLEFVLKATGWSNKEKISMRIDEVMDSVYLNGLKNKMPFELVWFLIHAERNMILYHEASNYR